MCRPPGSCGASERSSGYQRHLCRSLFPNVRGNNGGRSIVEPILIGGAIVGAGAAIALAPVTGGGSLLVFATP